MNIFMMCVGARDPYNPQKGTEGPILTFLKRISQDPDWKSRQPDMVYLLSTTGGPRPTLENAKKTKVEIENRYRPVAVSVKEMEVPNPHIYNEVLPKMRERLIEIVEAHKNNRPKYFVNYSPGTPQMQALWVSFVTSGLIKARLYQTIEPMKTETPGDVKEVEISYVKEDLAKERGTELFKKYLFLPCMSELARLFDSLIDERGKNAKQLHSLCQAYYLWDVLDYKEAYERLKWISFSNVKLDGILENQLKVLSRVKNGEEKYHITDLYHNAERRREQGDYPNALTIIATICELIAKSQVRRGLNQRFGVKVSQNFAKAIEATPEASQWVEGVLFREIPKHLNISPAIRLWEAMAEDPEFPVSASANQIQIMESLPRERTKRVHRGQKVEKGRVEKLSKTIRKLIKATYFKDFSPIDGYPFSRETLNSIGALLPQLLR